MFGTMRWSKEGELRWEIRMPWTSSSDKICPSTMNDGVTMVQRSSRRSSKGYGEAIDAIIGDERLLTPWL